MENESQEEWEKIQKNNADLSAIKQTTYTLDKKMITASILC